MSIIEIWVITWIHAIREPYHRPSEAYNRAIDRFIRSGHIVSNANSGSGYLTTIKGDDLVRRLKDVEA